MKYRLPTGHFIYFGAQTKKENIDSAGKDINTNISGILVQARLALDYPIFDPETNRKHLVDHVFIISANNLTKQARALLMEHLDKDEKLDLCLITGINAENTEDEFDIPF